MMEDFFSNVEFRKGEPEAGKLLISEPFMFDINFKRTVVLLVEHNEEGSVGFILNRNTDHKVVDIMPEFPKPETALFVGGPVGNDNLFFIHTLGEGLIGSKKIFGNLYWGGDFELLKQMLIDGRATDDQVRFFIGYSGWSPGQLEFELEEKSWLMARMSEDLIMGGRDKHFWKKALAGMGDKYKVMANFPENPSNN